jgi:hypothetical protein
MKLTSLRLGSLLLATGIACGSGSTPTPSTSAGSSEGSGSSSAPTGATGSDSSGSTNASGSVATAGAVNGASGAGSGTPVTSGSIDSGSGTGSAAGSGSVSGTGSSSGSPASGSISGAPSGSSGGASGAASSGSTAGYAGKPFKGVMQQIPGIVRMSDYDTGGPGVAYCHGNGTDCTNRITTSDWRNYTGVYRPVAPGDKTCGGAGCMDNVGICHMNGGEPDNYAASGPSFTPLVAPFADGPTLTGPMVKIGTNVMPQDVYVCYTTSPDSTHPSGQEWIKYTVQVTEPGTFAIGGFMGTPAGVTVSFDFGNGITSGTVMIPESPTNGCNCPETYHSWLYADNLGTVTIPAAGTYVLTFNLLTLQINPDYFTFRKM